MVAFAFSKYSNIVSASKPQIEEHQEHSQHQTHLFLSYVHVLNGLAIDRASIDHRSEHRSDRVREISSLEKKY
jgi:hypothetical protein